MAAKYPTMNWDTPNRPEVFKLFKQRMSLVIEDNEVTDKPKIARKIKIGLGDEGLRRLNASGLSAEHLKDPEKIWSFFEDQLNISVHFRVHRLDLMFEFEQEEHESLDEFVSRARTHALQCEFTDDELQERVIELVIASTPIELFRRSLLDKGKDLTLDQVLKEGRQHEAASKGSLRLDAFKRRSRKEVPKVDYVQKHDEKGRQKPCGNCGRKHKYRDCPAYNSKCDHCGNMGHWIDCCHNKKLGHPKNSGATASTPDQKPRNKSYHKKKGHKKVHAVQNEASSTSDDSDSGDEPIKAFYAVTLGDLDAVEQDKAFTNLHVKIPHVKGKHTLKVKLDTGANANALPLRTFRQMYGDRDPHEILTPTTKAKLTSYSGNTINCFGTMVVRCKSETSQWHEATFYVVEVDGPVILGLPTCEALGLITINCTRVKVDQITQSVATVDDLKCRYPDQFDAIGRFKEPAKILLKPDAEPHINRPRKSNVNLLPKIKEGLKEMEETGVIRKVTKHTDWCSSLVYSTKKDGSLRICLDPKFLNNAIKRCPHKMPTLEEVNPKFAGAKIFSKLDAKAGYWSVPLEEKSQLLTTFRTPFGRYCFRRLPFGLNISQDIFQQRMDEFLENLDGCVGIADDICVFGRTEEEHDKHLIALMDAAKEYGLVFNSEKCTIKSDSISFFGNTYSEEGISPDPAKVQAITEMPEPKNPEDLQRFLGLLTYLGTFIPNLSSLAAPLRDLLKKDSVFIWEETHTIAVTKLKEAITSRIIGFYDVAKPISIEVDASMKGLGACLVQEGKPIAFASKTLTTTQSHYSNIEREMLAVVYGVERFTSYLYGRSFTVVSDHKPLEMIARKALSSAPPRLQRMLLKIQGYDYSVMYRPGSQMVISDTLSRLPNPKDTGNVTLDIRVDDITLDLIHFSPEKQHHLRTKTRECPVLNALAEVIYTGWPESIKELPTDLRPYWSFRDMLGIEDGVIFKGKQVVIPSSMQPELLKQLHVGHQGIEKTRLLARETIYWPGINDDISKMIKTCPLCQEFQEANTKEPMIPTEVPDGPWKVLGTDLFEIKGRMFIIVSDYYSKFPLVKELSSATSASVASYVEGLCSMFGKPNIIRSDNGPQYTGEAFQKTCREWEIQHVTSSPEFPQSNGFIERQIKWIKPILKKAMKSGQNIQKVLLNIRATPIDNVIPSPGELLMNRKLTASLPFRSEETASRPVKERMLERQSKAKAYHDRGSKDLPPLYPGQKVSVFDKSTHAWRPGQVIETTAPRSYIVENQKGNMVRRNRAHLQDRPERRPLEIQQPTTPTRPPPPPVSPRPSHPPMSPRPSHPPASNMSPRLQRPPSPQPAPKHLPPPKPPSRPLDAPASPAGTTTRSGRVSNMPSRYKD